MELLFKHAWMLFILATVINGFVLKTKSKKYISKNPELEIGYKKLFSGWIILGNIPWLIIGIGDVFNLTHNIFDYLNPKLLNPIVLVFHFSIIVLWILSIRWVYFKNGAEFLEKHPGLILQTVFIKTNEKLTAKQIKIFIGLALLGGIIGIITMWGTNIHYPKL